PRVDVESAQPAWHLGPSLSQGPSDSGDFPAVGAQQLDQLLAKTPVRLAQALRGNALPGRPPRLRRIEKAFAQMLELHPPVARQQHRARDALLELPHVEGPAMKQEGPGGVRREDHVA